MHTAHRACPTAHTVAQCAVNSSLSTLLNAPPTAERASCVCVCVCVCVCGAQECYSATTLFHEPCLLMAFFYQLGGPQPRTVGALNQPSLAFTPIV